MASALPFLLLLTAGCGGGGEQAIKEIVLSPLVLQDSFALYYPVTWSKPARIPSYQVSPDLSNVAGIREVALPPGVSRKLAESGFAVSTGTEDHMYQVYEGRPGAKFVTVDALVHTLDVLAGYTLREIEKDRLASDLGGLVLSLYHTVERMRGGAQGTVREASLDDLAYLGVAARLLEVEVDIPSEVQGAVEDELQLIAAHSASTTSPVLGYQQDYGRYDPRGLYAGQPDLEAYFQALTWMGGTGLFPRPGTTPSELSRGRDMTRQALLLVGALHMSTVDGEPALEVWDRIYQPTSFMVGVSDSLDVYIYTRLAGEVFGQRFALSRLGDDAAMDAFIDRALEEAPPSLEIDGRGEAGTSFHFFGQSLIPDAYILEQLVAPQVPERLLPRGLDVPAAYGSDRALELAGVLYGDTSYAEYSQNMQKFRDQFSGMDPLQVHSCLYWSWIESLQALFQPCLEGYPTFMRGTAWQDRELYTFLGSWVELRHGTVSYDRSGSAADAGTPATVAKGYVEPRPEAFARLAATVDMLRRGLSQRGLGGASTLGRLGSLYQLLVDLKTMAEKELRNEALTAQEYQAVAGIGTTLRNLATFPVQGEEGVASGSDPSMALVVDIHADPDFGEALQAAIGRTAIYYVIAPVEGRPTLTVGAGFSYYELVRPWEERLTDGTWREMLDAGQVPSPPAWTISFMQ